jgi:hypothetical protein
MQQIGVNGPLHFLEDCILLADQIYPNRHPIVTLFTIYNTTNKPKTRTHEEPFNIYQITGPVHWHTGHILFFLYTPAGQVYFLRFFFLNSSWTGHLHFFTQTISVFFFCSTVDWALSLFYQFNCCANRYFEEDNKMHRPITLINIEQSLKKSVQKMQQTCFRILVEHMHFHIVKMYTVEQQTRKNFPVRGIFKNPREIIVNIFR